MKYEKTAYRLKEALNDIGMSQIELSEKAKINRSSISHYVLGRNEPGNKSAYAMAKVLGVNPAWLMGIDAPKYKDIPIDISDKDFEKAAELYEKYLHAIPEIRSAIDALLKPKSDP
jgi:transcriptional regulator with XRE-family HTH domain